MDYIKVDDIEDATHWVATSDERYTRERVTLGIPYKLFLSRDGEISIIDDYKSDINLWLCHNGYFVKRINK